jgi:CRP-like cAMP-binding protein
LLFKLQHKKVLKNDVLIKEGHEATHIYFVKKGEFEMKRKLDASPEKALY